MQRTVPVPRIELSFIECVRSNLITGMSGSTHTNCYCVKIVEAVRNCSSKVAYTGTNQATDIITTSVNIIDCIAVSYTSGVAPYQATDIVGTDNISID